MEKASKAMTLFRTPFCRCTRIVRMWHLEGDWCQKNSTQSFMNSAATARHVPKSLMSTSFDIGNSPRFHSSTISCVCFLLLRTPVRSVEPQSDQIFSHFFMTNWQCQGGSPPKVFAISKDLPAIRNVNFSLFSIEKRNSVSHLPS